MRRADQVGAILLLAFAAFVIHQASRLPYRADYGPGPGFIPLWLGIILGGCSIALLAGARKRRDDRPVFTDRAGVVRLVWIGVATLLLTVAMPIVGTAVAIGLFMGGLVWRMSPAPSWVTVLSLAVLTPVGVHLLFVRWLGVPLPKGLLGF